MLLSPNEMNLVGNRARNDQKALTSPAISLARLAAVGENTGLKIAAYRVGWWVTRAVRDGLPVRDSGFGDREERTLFAVIRDVEIGFTEVLGSASAKKGMSLTLEVGW